MSDNPPVRRRVVPAVQIVKPPGKKSGPACMDKRSRFIAELRREAKERGLQFREETWRGKGGHAMVWVGDKVTTVSSREIDPKTAKNIRKALGLD
jgi:hypothetical protein